MIDHVSIGVSDFQRSLAFYDAVLTPLGYDRCFAVDGVKQWAAYGPDKRPLFWLARREEMKSIVPSEGFHLAFQAKSRGDVDAFYAAAIASGARDNGSPGLRPHYHSNYYAAFVFDPDGYNVEAVCHL